MRNLKLFFNKHFRNTVYSNVWIALGSGLYTIQTCIIFDLPWWPTSIFVAVSTFATYNFQRLIKLRRKPEFYTPGRNQWIFRNRKLIGLLCGLSMLACIGLIFLFSFRDVLFLGIPIAVSLLYVQPLKVLQNRLPDLREIPLMKVIWVGLIWMWVSVLFPLFHHSQDLNTSFVIIWAITQMIFIIGITIPFDIRDLPYDSASYKTVPQLFGIRGAKIVAIALICGTFFGWSILFRSGFININSLAAQFLCLMTTVIVVSKTKQDQPELYFTGLIDGLIILSGASLILTES